MDLLIETFPFTFGVLIGLTWHRFGGPGRGRIGWLIASVALGSFATLASGEWRESPLYFLVDFALVAVVSAATAYGLATLRRRKSRID